jgi:alkanesulfonate monooxygenase SsuD/methylene tetrahydromethanopterin reductase-like flavin-dependent oxidoreductase (luciferase family)
MTALAGEVADGFVSHPLTNTARLQSVSLPALHRGIARAGRAATDVQVSCQLMVATGTDREIEAARYEIRHQVACFASAPYHRATLEAAGLGDLAGRARHLLLQPSDRGLHDVVTDEVLEHFSVTSSLERLATRVRERVGGLVDRIAFCLPPSAIKDPAAWSGAITELRSIPSRAAAAVDWRPSSD